MAPKQKKISLWTKCSTCGLDVASKDAKIHAECCQSSNESWNTPFISGGMFFTVLENKDLIDSSAGPNEGYIVLHYSVIQSCGFVIGEPVKVKCCSSSLKPIVRRVWPSTSVNEVTSAALNFKDLESTWKNEIHLKICVSKFKERLILCETVHFSTDFEVTEHKGFTSFLKYSQRNKIFSPSDAINLKYLGKSVTVNLLYFNNKNYGNELASEEWFVCDENTNWILQNCEKVSTKCDNDIINIAGVDDILDDIFSIMNIVLKNNVGLSNVKLLKSVLLYGPSGTGKTMISKYVASQSNVNVINVNTFDIYSKFYGETEAALKKLFSQALKNSPSIVLIDDIDILCPKRSSSGTEQEKRITSTLATLLDSVHEADIRVFVICCSSKIDVVESSLRRFGRIDREIEVPIPDQSRRFEILKSMLLRITHNLEIEEIKMISDAAHGYVGADIANLCTQASMHMLRNAGLGNTISLEDFQWALNHVNPSAMREVLVDIPNVKWSDVGGQEDLKLKLKQLVEWPLKYSESFSRLGIKPPSGILMYGPPGCSKTMIAKAVASESHLNFLSIKGPELFSKWVGESERAVRELFRKARQVAPSVIFFDEIDALGTERTKSSNGSNVQERILAQLLTEMDGITPLGNVTIIAATNRPDKIDPALLRPGRLDRIVYVPLPDESTRRSIFELRLSKMPLSKSVNIDHLVIQSDGYSGAEITAICHEAALKALEENINVLEVSAKHFDQAFDIVKPRTPESLLLLYKEFGKSSK